MKEDNQQKRIGLKIVIPVAIVVLIAVVFASISVQKPVGGGNLVYSSSANSAVYSALSKVGITESNTFDEGNTIRVTYQLPEESEKEGVEFFVMGVLSSIAQSKEKAIIASYTGADKVGEIEVQMTDIMSFKNKQISDSELRSRIKRNL